MEFSWQEYWSVLPFPSPGNLPDPGFEPGSPALQADSLLSESPEKPSFHYTNVLRASSQEGNAKTQKSEWWTKYTLSILEGVEIASLLATGKVVPISRGYFEGEELKLAPSSLLHLSGLLFAPLEDAR